MTISDLRATAARLGLSFVPHAACPRRRSQPYARVYALADGDTVIYIGKTRLSLNARIKSHLRLGRRFSEVLTVDAAALDAEWIEKLLIYHLDPPLNRFFTPAYAGRKLRAEAESFFREATP